MFFKKNYSDSQIIQLIKDGDTDILVYLFEKNYVTARNYITGFKGNDKDIKNCLQETVLRFWYEVRNSKEPSAGKINVNKQLFQILKGEWERYMTNAEEEWALHQEADLGNDIDKLKSDSEKYDDKVGKAAGYLGYLSAPCKELLQLYFYDQLSDEELLRKTDTKSVEDLQNKKELCIKKLEQIIKNNFSAYN